MLISTTRRMGHACRVSGQEGANIISLTEEHVIRHQRCAEGTRIVLIGTTGLASMVMRGQLMASVLNQSFAHHGARASYILLPAPVNTSKFSTLLEAHFDEIGGPSACVILKYPVAWIGAACRRRGALVFGDSIDNHRAFSKATLMNEHYAAMDALVVQTEAHASLVAGWSRMAVVLPHAHGNLGGWSVSHRTRAQLSGVGFVLADSKNMPTREDMRAILRGCCEANATLYVISSKASGLHIVPYHNCSWAWPYESMPNGTALSRDGLHSIAIPTASGKLALRLPDACPLHASATHRLAERRADAGRGAAVGASSSVVGTMGGRRHAGEGIAEKRVVAGRGQSGQSGGSSVSDSGVGGTVRGAIDDVRLVPEDGEWWASVSDAHDPTGQRRYYESSQLLELVDVGLVWRPGHQQGGPLAVGNRPPTRMHWWFSHHVPVIGYPMAAYVDAARRAKYPLELLNLTTDAQVAAALRRIAPRDTRACLQHLAAHGGARSTAWFSAIELLASICAVARRCGKTLPGATHEAMLRAHHGSRRPHEQR